MTKIVDETGAEIFPDPSLEDIYGQSDTEDAEMFLEFYDNEDYGTIERRVTDILGEFSFEEIMEMNDMEEDEALSLLVSGGFIGLPETVEYEEEIDGQVQDNENEEDET